MIFMVLLKMYSLANFVTLIRLLLVPVFVALLISNTAHGEWLAVVVFIVAAVTDSIDGYLARFRNEVTEFGQALDPLVDKILISAALISLVSLGKLSAWIATLIISRELVVSVLRVVAKANGVVIAVNSWGKIKTASQILAISWWLLVAKPQTNVVAVTLMTLAVIITVVSGLFYLQITKFKLEQKLKNDFSKPY